MPILVPTPIFLKIIVGKKGGVFARMLNAGLPVRGIIEDGTILKCRPKSKGSGCQAVVK
jgi:hypothetical protein